MKRRVIAIGLLAVFQLYPIGCGLKKNLSAGDIGVIGSKGGVFAAIDRESYEKFVSAIHVNDQVEQVNFAVHGRVFDLIRGTKVKVLFSYVYSGSTVYKVKVLDGLHEGSEAFINFDFVDSAS